MRYTDYLIPNGSGTRIVSYAAPLFSIETGETLPDETLAESEGFLTEGHGENMKRLIELADAAAASLLSV